MNSAELSVIVCTKNSGETLKKCLKSIFKSSLKPFEVLIVDGLSTDGTIEIAKQFSVKIYYDNKKGVGFARKIGVEKAHGKFIAMIDSDSRIPPNWFERMLRNFERDPKLGGVEDICPSENLERFMPRLESYVRLIRGEKERKFQDLYGGRCYIGTSNSIWLNEAIVNAGNFDPRFLACEDLDLSYRVWKKGYHVKIDTDTMSYHYSRTKWMELFKQQFNLGFYHKMVCKKHKGIKPYSKKIPRNEQILYAVNALNYVWRYYRKTGDKFILLTPIYYILRRIPWILGFLVGSCTSNFKRNA